MRRLHVHGHPDPARTRRWPGLRSRKISSRPGTGCSIPSIIFLRRVDKKWLEETLTKAFADVRHCVFPPDAMDNSLQVLHKLGYTGPMWDLLLPRQKAAGEGAECRKVVSSHRTGSGSPFRCTITRRRCGTWLPSAGRSSGTSWSSMTAVRTAMCRSLLAGLDVVVLKHEKNLGKGQAILTASRYIEEQGGPFMITIDADGQHYPRDIERFLPAARRTCRPSSSAAGISIPRTCPARAGSAGRLPTSG